MRKLRDLDEEIRRAEQRLEARRAELNVNLYASRVQARRTLTSPQMLIGAVVVGFLIDRLGRLKPHKQVERRHSSGMSGIVAGLGAAALKSAISNPSLWQSLRRMWKDRYAHEPDAEEVGVSAHRLHSTRVPPRMSAEHASTLH